MYDFIYYVFVVNYSLNAAYSLEKLPSACRMGQAHLLNKLSSEWDRGP